MLVADAFMSSVIRETRFPDTGSVREDLRAQMQRLAGIFRGPRGRILRSLIGGGQSDPELIAAFSSRWLMPRRIEAFGILQRGIDRGQLPADIDRNMLLDTLYGPLYFRMLVGHGPLSSAFVDDVCDAVMSGVMIAPSATLGENIECFAKPRDRFARHLRLSTQPNAKVLRHLKKLSGHHGRLITLS